MKAVLLALAATAQWGAWGAGAPAGGTAPWASGPWTTGAGWSPYAAPASWSSPWSPWGPSVWWGAPGADRPGAAESDPIVIPLSTDVPGVAQEVVHLSAYSPSGATLITLRALDADLDLSVRSAGGGVKAVSAHEGPTETIVLVHAGDPWMMIRVVPREAAKPSRFILRAAPAAVGEAVVGTGGAEAAAPWGTTTLGGTLMPQGISPWGAGAAAAAFPWMSPPTVSRQERRVTHAEEAELPTAPSRPAAAPASPTPAPSAAAASAPAEPSASAAPSAPQTASGAAPPGPDAPPGVAAVIRPGGEVSGSAEGDIYYAVKVENAAPFTVTLEMGADVDLDLVVWASNGTRSWESARTGSSTEEVRVDPVTDSWYVVRIAARSPGRYTLRIR